MNRQKILFTTASVLNSLAALTQEEAEQVLKNIHLTLQDREETPAEPAQPVTKTYRIKIVSPQAICNAGLVCAACNALNGEFGVSFRDAKSMLDTNILPKFLWCQSHETTNEHFSRLVSVALSLNNRFRRACEGAGVSYADNFSEVVEVTI